MPVIVGRSNPSPKVVCVGDSITYGTNSGDDGGTTSYPYHLATALGLSYDYLVRNVGSSGLGTADLFDVDYLLEPSRTCHLIVMAGVNDLLQTADSAATIFARLQAYVAARQAAGWIVTVCTVTVIGTASAPQNVVRLAYNTLIRAGFTRVVDLAANANIGDGATTPSAWVTADLVHLTNTGNALAASLINTFLAANLTGTWPTRQTSFSTVLTSDLTANFREWQGMTPQTRRMYRVDSLTSKRVLQRYHLLNDDLSANPRVTKTGAVLNGHTAMDFPGEGTDDGAWLGSFTPLSDVWTSTGGLFHALVYIRTITAASGTPYFRSCIAATAGGEWGVSLTPSTSLVTGFLNDGGVKETAGTGITLNTWTLVSMRLTGGNLSMRVGHLNAWGANTAVSPIAVMTSAIRMGTGAIINHPMDGRVAEVIYRRAYSAERDADDIAYFVARYGI
jgi:lysophospholipase L1-like esterase